MTRKGAESVPVESLSWWDQLQHNEQSTVSREHESTHSALSRETESRKEAGKHLLETRKILAPKRLWGSYLKSQFGMSVATAYRYIAEFEKSNKGVPKPLLDVAKEMGYSVSPEIIEQNPPPDTDDKPRLVRYLKSISGKQPKIHIVEANPNTLLKELVHAVELDWNKLPHSSKTKTNFSRNFIGMSMTVFGISRRQSFSPVPIPEHFKVHVGRPKGSKKAA